MNLGQMLEKIIDMFLSIFKLTRTEFNDLPRADIQQSGDVRPWKQRVMAYKPECHPNGDPD